MRNHYDVIEKAYKNELKKDLKDEKISKFKESYILINSLESTTALNNDDLVCSEKPLKSSSLDALYSISKYLDDFNIDSNVLFNNKNLNSLPEAIQLLIAPSCLNKSNRVKIDEDYSCDNNSELVKLLKEEFKGNDLYNAFRLKIQKNLERGLALGNTFSPNGPGRLGHINTIVGMRFNKDLNRCEYKIRESQDGKSHWKDEKFIIDKIILQVFHNHLILIKSI